MLTYLSFAIRHPFLKLIFASTTIILLWGNEILYAQTTGSCDGSTGSANLNVNEVKALVLNNGGLFRKEGDPVYTVPKIDGINSIFASGIWIGGMVNGQLRAAAADYAGWEFWPGPLDANGNLPGNGDCSQYDRIWEIRLSDIDTYEATGIASSNLMEWPWDLGAPVLDGDGNPNNYNLAGGDRPELIGHQMLWWIMNDVGNSHSSTGTAPMGMEVQVTAFAASSKSEAIQHTTFYKYKMIYKGTSPINNAWFGIWSDPDLGYAIDDYVGTDTTLNLGFVYNADNKDDGSNGYGQGPPALGYSILQGLLADNDGVDNNYNGTIDEPGERLMMTRFLYYQNDTSDMGNPRNLTSDWYNYLQGIWKDGSKMCLGDNGFNPTTCTQTTKYAFSGDPVTKAYWSEVNIDGSGIPNIPGDRRFLMSMGPFTMNPGDVQEITFAIVWGQGDDNLSSVSVMREAVREVIEIYEEGLNIEPAPAPESGPQLSAPADGATNQPRNPTLFWQSIPGISTYEFQLSSDEAFTSIVQEDSVDALKFTVGDIAGEQTYYWRVRGVNISGEGPWSEVWKFSTSEIVLQTGGPLFIDSDPAFIEVQGPDGFDPCGPDAISTFGCTEVGGNFIYPSFNSTGEYIMSSQGEGPEASVGNFAPKDFEIRWTESGSYGYHSFTTGNAIWTPVEVWDIGPTGPFGENDPSDDVQMILNIFSDNGGECEFAVGEISEDPFGVGWPGTDQIYAYYPTGTYADWEALIKPLVEGDPDNCPNVKEQTGGASEDMVDFSRGRPLQRVVFYVNPGSNLTGTIARFLTTSFGTEPPVPSAPRNRAVGLSETVSIWWNPVLQVQSYALQVATSPDFVSPIVDLSNLTGTTYELSNLSSGASYYWHVRTEASEWSETWAFTIGTATGVDGESLPEKYTLEQNYPNPFNPSTTIRYALARPGPVRLEVFDVLGRRVLTVVDARQRAGRHTVRVDLQGYPSGVYVYRLQTPGFTRTRRMILLE